MRERIKLDGPILECLLLMAEGNPGAISVMSMMMTKIPEAHWPITMLHLDDMNIRGPQIWVGYKDFCDQDISRFIECVKIRDTAMIDAINKEMFMDPSWTEVAVSGGGSRRMGI